MIITKDAEKVFYKDTSMINKKEKMAKLMMLHRYSLGGSSHT